MSKYDPYTPRNPAVPADEAMSERRETRAKVISGGPNVAADQLRSFLERIERLEEEKAGVADDIKEVFAEAKGTGFDPKVMRAVLKIRKQDPNERMEFETVLDTYLAALGMIDGGVSG